MAQAQGKSFNPDQLEKISRYEVPLDKKFKNTLGLLITLQDRRRARQAAAKAQSLLS
jgi:hypothetical protein